MPADMTRKAEIDSSILKDILERALAMPRPESEQRKNQRKRRDEKVKLWKILQKENRLEGYEKTTNIPHTETIHESNASEDLCKIMAGSETDEKMVETPAATSRLQDS